LVNGSPHLQVPSSLSWADYLSEEEMEHDRSMVVGVEISTVSAQSLIYSSSKSSTLTSYLFLSPCRHTVLWLIQQSVLSIRRAMYFTVLYTQNNEGIVKVFEDAERRPTMK